MLSFVRDSLSLGFDNLPMALLSRVLEYIFSWDLAGEWMCH